jgi:hypothetical protein
MGAQPGQQHLGQLALGPLEGRSEAAVQVAGAVQHALGEAGRGSRRVHRAHEAEHVHRRLGAAAQPAVQGPHAGGLVAVQQGGEGADPAAVASGQVQQGRPAQARQEARDRVRQ